MLKDGIKVKLKWMICNSKQDERISGYLSISMLRSYDRKLFSSYNVHSMEWWIGICSARLQWPMLFSRVWRPEQCAGSKQVIAATALF